MTVSITHTTVAVGTDVGNGEVHKSTWNEAHTVTGLGTSATVDTGTSGTKIPLLDGANTWSATQAFSTITVGTGTITALAANNSPDTSNDFTWYYSASAGAMRKATIGAISSAGASGVSSFNGRTGAVSPAANDYAVTDLSGLATGIATFLGTPTSANLAAAVTNETGSGLLVFATSPTLTTPILGTPTSGTLTNCTLPVGGVTGLGTGVGTFLATPSSANLASAVTDETGTGALVFANTPTLVSPILGTPTSGALTNCTFPTLNQNTTGSAGTLSPGRTINGTAFDGSTNITVTAAAGTLTGATLASGVTASSLTSFGSSPTLTTPILGTPTSGTLTNCTLPVGGLTGLGTGVATFLATPSSANLISAVTDETGTGALVFANTPTLVTPALGTPGSGNLANCTFPTLNQNTSGSAGTLSPGRTINGTAFDGSTNITITAAAGTLTGVTLASGVTASSLTSFGATALAGLGIPAASAVSNIYVSNNFGGL